MSLLADRGGLASAGSMLIIAVGIVASGCASSKSVKATKAELRELRLAVLPEVWVTGETEPALQAASSARRAIEAEEIFSLIAPEFILPEMNKLEDPVACFDDLACIRDVGLRLGADKLALLRIGRLGDTVVLRLSMVDVGGAKMENTLQEVASSPDPIQDAVERLSNRFVDLIKPDPPWYGRWWVLASAAAVVVGAVGVTTWLLVRDTGPDRPDLIMPP